MNAEKSEEKKRKKKVNVWSIFWLNPYVTLFMAALLLLDAATKRLAI